MPRPAPAKHVRIAHGPHVPLIRDPDLWQPVLAAVAAGRVRDLLDWVGSGAVVPLAPGTTVAVDAREADRLTVRVLGGPDAGTRGLLSISAVAA
jgi:hypothetical protein